MLIGLIVVGGLLAGILHNLAGFWAGFGLLAITIFVSVLVMAPLVVDADELKRPRR